MATARMFTILSFVSCFLFAAAAPSTIQSTPLVKRDVVQFAIDLTWEDFNPTGGVSRKAILTNGTVPGPALKLTVGQSVEFTVINNLPNSTSVHFHGIAQTGTPYSDGVPGLTQYPIPAGGSFLYQWTADEAGTYFYHAHHKGQMMDGLYGAIIIEAAEDAPRPFTLMTNDTAELKQMMTAEKKNEPIFISDWTQYTFNEFYDIQQAANIDNACADSIIVNGKGSVYCLDRATITSYTNPLIAPLLQSVTPSQLTDKACLPPNLAATQGNFTFNLAALPAPAYEQCTPSTGETSTISVSEADGWAAMTFINSGGFSSLKFTIDSHKFWVYAVNGHYVVPQFVDTAVVDNGDRYSIMVKLDQPIGTYTMRVANNGLNQVISGYGALEYVGSTGYAPGAVQGMNVAGIPVAPITAFVDDIAGPYPAVAPASTASATFMFDIEKVAHPYQWTLVGNDSYSMDNDDQTPLLFLKPDQIPQSDLIFKTNDNEWVDIIVKVEGPIAQPHPIHKHANKVYMLGQGVGPFPYASVAEAAAAMPAGTFNFATPPYRDGFTTLPAEGNSSWMALRYQANNPGAWVVHCHMQTHFSGGMAAVLLDGVDKFPSVPAAYSNGSEGFGYNATQAGSSSSASSGASKTGSSSSASSGASKTGSSSSSSSTGSSRANGNSTAGIATFTGAASSLSFSSMITFASAFFVAALFL